MLHCTFRSGWAATSVNVDQCTHQPIRGSAVLLMRGVTPDHSCGFAIKIGDAEILYILHKYVNFGSTPEVKQPKATDLDCCGLYIVLPEYRYGHGTSEYLRLV